MSSEYPHLNPKSIEALSLSNDERIKIILKNRWIGYTRGKEALSKLEDLLTHPTIHRMPNLLIVGETNNGKTSIVRRFISRHPADDDLGGENAVIPVLFIEAPAVPDEDNFYCEILETVFSPFKYSSPTAQKRHQVYDTLRYLNVKILVIDEIHNLLAGRKEKQQGFLNAIKKLGNTLKIPIVALGVKEAARAISTDPQMANRFEPFHLPKWVHNEEYLSLLMSFELMLPLKQPSNLAQDKTAKKILAMSEGSIGEIVQILKNASTYAIRTNTEKIDAKILTAIKWTPPSKRRVESGAK